MGKPKGVGKIKMTTINKPLMVKLLINQTPPTAKPCVCYCHSNSVAINNCFSRSQREVKSASHEISNQSFKNELT